MNKEYVSRSYQKLVFALKHFNISVLDKICADLGSSTGGFVQCLLDNGASKVYSVDTSYGELDYSLRQNPKVVVIERTNAIHVKLPEPCDFISVDVSWTRQELILPNVLANLKPKGFVVSLIKPHYEAKPDKLVKGKLKEEFIPDVLNEVRAKISAISNLIELGVVESPILGSRGKNKEFLLFLTKS